MVIEHDGCKGCKFEKYSETSIECQGCKQNATDKYERMTNEDRIRVMPTEELAELLVGVELEEIPSDYYDDETQVIFRSITGKRFYYKEQAIKENIKWLKKEVEDE